MPIVNAPCSTAWLTRRGLSTVKKQELHYAIHGPYLSGQDSHRLACSQLARRRAGPEVIATAETTSRAREVVRLE